MRALHYIGLDLPLPDSSLEDPGFEGHQRSTHSDTVIGLPYEDFLRGSVGIKMYEGFEAFLCRKREARLQPQTFPSTKSTLRYQNFNSEEAQSFGTFDPGFQLSGTVAQAITEE